MNVWLVPLNPTVGAIQRNAERIGRQVADIVSRTFDEFGSANVSNSLQPPDLIVFPELAITGYPPKDLILQEGFLAAAELAADQIGRDAPHGVTIVLGLPLSTPAASIPGITNSLLAYRDARRIARYDKRLLPTYDVFDEDRYFVPGDAPIVIEVPVVSAPESPAIRVGLSICEDLWRGDDVGFSSRYLNRPDPVEALVDAGAQVIVNPSASPFVIGKAQRHRDLVTRHAVRHGVPILAVNQLGGNDELIFDGAAFAIDHAGHVIAGVSSESALGFCGTPFHVRVPVPASRSMSLERARTAHPSTRLSDPLSISMSDEESLARALVLGVRDYAAKTGFTSALLGLSGGIDSALTAVIAAAALGPDRVHGVALPSRYSSEHSLADAAELARRLRIGYEVISIEPAFESMLASLAASFADRPVDVTEENLQSRVRGTILMGLSNKFRRLLLTTGNKSELAVGYCTLYGDMNGGLAVLSDVTKQWVYRLARWINAHPAALFAAAASPESPPHLLGPIPESSITKPPSAELRPGQTDQDSLPPYPVLDEIIERYVERRQSRARIASETGFDNALVARILRLIDTSEFKRKQAAIGLKVTSVAFGSGRRYPIAQAWTP